MIIKWNETVIKFEIREWRLVNLRKTKTHGNSFKPTTRFQ